MRLWKPLKNSALAVTSKPITGGALLPSAAIADDYQRAVVILIRKMADETKRELRRMFDDPAYAMDAIADGNPASRARIIINRLIEKYEPIFNKWAKKSTDRMIARTLKSSTITLGMSLKEFGEHIDIRADLMNDRMREIITASTNEGAQLIKTIPSSYLAEVQGQVMRSITSGRGLQDLIPFMNTHYGQAVRKARNVAFDQTRKAYASVNAARLQASGVKKFEWRHSHGGKNPRKQHEEWNGKIFSFDDLPIDDRFGPVIPGQAIGCGCFAKPVLSFGDDDE